MTCSHIVTWPQSWRHRPPKTSFFLRAEDFPPELPDHLDFDGLVIDTGFRRQIEWIGGDSAPFTIRDRTFGFDGYAMPEGYRLFGLWLLHLLFSGRDWAGLNLTHERSLTKSFYASVERPGPSLSGLRIASHTRYSGYHHTPQQVSRHPFADPEISSPQRLDGPEDRPLFVFGWSETGQDRRWDIASADQLILAAPRPVWRRWRG